VKRELGKECGEKGKRAKGEHLRKRKAEGSGAHGEK
jgi:hypothetical protein